MNPILILALIVLTFSVLLILAQEIAFLLCEIWKRKGEEHKIKTSKIRMSDPLESYQGETTIIRPHIGIPEGDYTMRSIHHADWRWFAIFGKRKGKQ